MLFPIDSQFTPILIGGAPLTDPAGDVNPSSTDIVGSAQYPAAYFAYDGTSVFFRLRLNGDPRSKNAFDNFAWGILFNTNGIAGTYQWVLAVNGLKSQLELIQNTTQQVNTWNDPAEGTDGKGTPNYAQPIVNYDIVRARATNDGSNFGGDTDYFLDFGIAASVLFRFLAINESSVIRMMFFSSANNNNFNKDTLLTQGFSFASAFTDPTTTEQSDMRAMLSVNKQLVSGPSSVLAGQVSSWTGTIQVTNTGKSAANSVIVNDSITLDVLSSLTQTVTQGFTNFDALNKILSWNVGNIPAGGRQTLSFTINGQFQSPGTGTRTLNTARSTGLDSQTGGTIPAASSSITISVQNTGGIAGIILDNSTGLPLPGAVIQLRNNTNQTIAQSSSDSGGAYGFTGIAPGGYTLTATLPNYTIVTVQTTVNSNSVTTLNLMLPPLPAAVQGKITDTGGVPIPGAMILLKSPFGAVLATQSSDANGLYAFAQLIPATYTIIAGADRYQAQTAGVVLSPNQTSNQNFALKANPATVAGTVTGNGIPIAGALVEVVNDKGQVIAFTNSGLAGTYSIGSLTPGTYRLRVSDPGFAAQLIGFTVGAGGSITINVDLAPNPGSLSGVITDAGTSQALSGTEIRLVNSGGITVAAVTANSDGSYSIPGIAPGSYTVTFAHNGYASSTLGTIITSDQTAILNASLQTLAGQLSGDVTDSSGSPIPSSVVRILMNQLIIATVNADNNGNYAVSNLAPGNYTVRAEAPNYQRSVLGALIEPFQTTTVNFQLDPNPSTIIGTVTDASGNPLAGTVLTVRIDTAAGPNVAKSISDINGQYTVLDLTPDDYFVTAAADGFQLSVQGIIVTPGSTQTLNFSLSPEPSTIQGTVFDETTGIPIPSATIEIRIMNSNGAVIATAFTDPSGNYLISSLAPGTYRAIASALNYQSDSATVVIGPNQIATLNLELLPDPGGIQGQITDSDTGAAIGGATVKVADSDALVTATAFTDHTGNYNVDGLAPGNYTVIATNTDYQTNTIGAIVFSNQTASAFLSLAPNPGSISGTLQPGLSGASVQLYDTNNVFIATRITDQNGRFLFDSLAPGLYTAVAAAADYAASRTGAHVSSNENTDILIPMLPDPATLTGIITDLSGNPLSKAVVTVMDQNDTILATGLADANGAYMADSIPPGTHTVQVKAPDYSQAIDTTTFAPGQTITGLNFILTPDSGSVSGQVTDSVSGTPIPGATAAIRALDQQGVIVKSVTTGQFGNFVIPDLAPGPYTVLVTADQYASDFVGVVIISNSSANASISLSPLPGTIQGAVQGLTGLPVTGTETLIRLYDANGLLLDTIFANPDGTFVLSNLQAGSYSIQAGSPGFANNTVTVNAVNGITTNVIIQLTSTPASVTGTIINEASNEPVEGAAVTVRDSAGDIVSQTVSDNNGSYQLDNVPSGQHTVTVTAPDSGTVTSGIHLDEGQSTTADYSLPPSPGSIGGFVISMASMFAIPGAVVVVKDSADTIIASVPVSNTGQYQVNNLTPGSYTAIANADGFSSQFGGVDVASGQQLVISFALNPLPGSVSGIVSNSSNGTPVEGAAVDIRLSNTFGPVLQTVSTTPSGTYSNGNLVPGNYTITVSKDGFTSQITSFDVVSNQNTTIDFNLQPVAATIVGTVSESSTDKPAAGVVIVISDENSTVVDTVQTGTTGSAVASGVPGGDLVVVAYKPDVQLQETLIFASGAPALPVHFDLAPHPGDVIGQVLNASTGGIITGAIVQILTENKVPVTQVATNAFGSYRISGLSTGVYTIAASAPGFGSDAALVQVSAGMAVPVTPLSFDPEPGNLRGMVTDPSFRPLASVLVQIFNLQEVLVRNVITNRLGQYAVIGLNPGVYLARFSLEGYVPELRRPAIRKLDTTILNVVLHPESEE
ncbi:hypothetical protein GCM10023310_65670 [Paenibacillus vulneris]|uniref:Carboxypeptidase regulatory-like domain-containing protein n=1 Tax=Paenibacillus vulneris TaxID=1133364 RepID=A0ABW3UH69_9BACL